MFKNNKNGFTLVELMITIAIIGILAAVALPAYQDYVARAQLSEGLSLASGLKPEVNAFITENGHLPDSGESVAIRAASSVPAGRYVDKVLIVESGRILAYMKPAGAGSAVGGVIELDPIITPSGSIVWFCASLLERKYLPSSCYKPGSLEYQSVKASAAGT